MEIDAMLAQELGLLVTGPELRSLQFPPGSCGATNSELPSVDGLLAVRPSMPSVCEQAYSILQTTGMRLLGVAQAGLPSQAVEDGACNTEVLSLTSFLDEDIPKFPFARSPDSAATWTRVTA